MPIRLLVCVTVLASLCTHSATLAVNYFWQNAVGGAFDEPSNWSPLVPQGPGGPNDTTHFDLGVAPSNRYVVTDAGRESDRLIVHDDSLELTIFINHALLSTGGNDPSLVVGAANGDTGDLILSSGGGSSVLETQVTRIANVAGSTGVVRVSDLEWNGGILRVGHAGTGTLTIDDDSMVSSTNASIGHFTSSTGTATVQGGGSWTMSGDLLIGREGTGSLSIVGGGSVTNVNGAIGTESSGDGSVTVGGFSNNNLWTNTGSLTVGGSGEGSLSITSGGTVSNMDAFVGRLTGSNGQVSAAFGSNWTTTGRLSIGGDADTSIGGGAGTVEISGAVVTVGEDIVIFPIGDLILDSGSLAASAITTQAGGEFEWTGGALRLDEFNGNLVNQGGLLLPHADSNKIIINGSYTQQAGGAVDIFIHGEAETNEYDSLDISATANLGGELRFALDTENGLFEPSPNEVFTILEATDLLGSFSNVANGQRVDDGNNNGSFVVNYGMGSPFDPHHVVLSSFLPAGPIGDYNGNGVVDAADYVMWRNNLGTTYQLLNDRIGGTIGLGHYNQWRSHFGETAGSGSGATAGLPSSAEVAIPEPATWMLIALGFAALLCRQR